MKKKKLTRILSCYGNIIKIEKSGIVTANIYDHKNHDFIDEIIFDISEFPSWQIKDLSEDALFKLSIGTIDKATYYNFRLVYKN